MNDFERVAQIIRYLDGNYREQPDLDALAARAGLSRYHFHRLFTRWAGVTPKDFLQCLTLEDARERLRRGESVLDAALGSGLSAPSRLHDLCLSLEAATPGEIKSGGEGWAIRVGFADSPFGVLCLGATPRGLCHLSFQDGRDRAELGSRIARDWPRASLEWDDGNARRLAEEIFKSPQNMPRPGELRAYVRATPFQLRVWRALVRIPAGALVGYGSLAAMATGTASAARAVGAAVGANPIAYLIPCHRVIRESGALGGFRWGMDRKKAMLGWEGARLRGAVAP